MTSLPQMRNVRQILCLASGTAVWAEIHEADIGGQLL
jgi:hypothetical protein